MATSTGCVCILAALISMILAVTSTSGARASDVPFLGFLVFPYVLMGLLSWWQRSRRRRSAGVFIAVLLLSLGGILLLGIDSFRFHTMPDHRMVQRFTMIAVPLLQTTATLAIALVLQLSSLVKGDSGDAIAPRGRR